MIVLAWHILSGRALLVSLGRMLVVLYAPPLLVCEAMKRAMQNCGLSHREEHLPFSSSWLLYCDELHGRIEIRTLGATRVRAHLFGQDVSFGARPELENLRRSFRQSLDRSPPAPSPVLASTLFVMAAVLLATACGVAWFGLHRPR
jgi:hypothetical protein